MSDDIDRLKTVLENLRQVNDTLQDHNDVMRDVVVAVQRVDGHADAEGYYALSDLATDIRLAHARLDQHVQNADALVWELRAKAHAGIVP